MKEHLKFSSVVAFGFLALFCGIHLGCKPDRPGKEDAALQVGTRPLSFSYTEAKEVLIARWDPATGENWTARAERSAVREGWTLLSATDWAVADDVANTSTIEHLLDSLSALRIELIPDRPDPQSQGLIPPRFAIRWTTGGSAPQDYEIKIGAFFKTPNTREGAFVSIRNGKEPEKLAVVSGSALALLAHMESALSLRHTEWAIEHIDDVDEFEFKRKGKLVLYAQREGDGWTDKEHRPLGVDLTPLLKNVLTARVKEFIEEPKALASTRASIEAGGIEIVITDRHGNASTLRAVSNRGKILATHSKRPKAAFELAPGSLDGVEVLSRGRSK